MRNTVKYRKTLNARRRLSGEAFGVGTISGNNNYSQYKRSNGRKPSKQMTRDLRRVGAI